MNTIKFLSIIIFTLLVSMMVSKAKNETSALNVTQNFVNQTTDVGCTPSGYMCGTMGGETSFRCCNNMSVICSGGTTCD